MTKLNLILAVLLVVALGALLINGCVHKKKGFEAKVMNITTEQLREKIKKGEDLILLDVRQPEEYAAGHIENALLIPLGELDMRSDELDKNKEIVVYCRSGRRSRMGADKLIKSGFTRVTNVLGGFNAW